MWIITGPFDGDVQNEVAFQKSKLLKSAKSYLIGRKSTSDLVVNHKKVSHDHGQFVVGGFSPDDVTNTDYVPTLRILNSKNKTMRIWREGIPDGVIVNPGATEELQTGDKVDIVSGLPLTVQWQRLCCFETPGKVRDPIPLDGCASLGVHVVRTLHPDITHHLVPSCALTPAHMTSLLSAAQLVKPEWLSELLALSILDPRESPRALENTFALPPESKFRPAYAAGLPSALKTFKAWEPNETRLNMFKGYRFVFVGEKEREIPAGYRELVKRGGAEYEAFTVSAGVVRWRKVLVKAKSLAEEKSGKVVIVADGGVMELAVGVEGWEELVSAAKNFDLEFIQPENILQAVAHVDTFYVDSRHAADSQAQSSRETPLPDVIPNSFPGEPSIAPPLRPPARKPGTAPEQAPPVAAPPGPTAPEPEIAEAPLPRRLPPRRATERNRTAPSPGPDDDGEMPPPLGPPLATTPSHASPAATQLPTPGSQARRLPPRRRANQGIEASMALVSSNAQPLPSQSSQLDKYKALFDASHPDRTSSQTQSETTTQGLRGADVLMLSAVPEEEESQSQILDPSGRNSNTTRGTKRSRPAGEGDDVEMPDVVADADVAADNADGTHRAKRRAVDVNSTQQQPATALRNPSSATNTQASKPESRKKPPSSSSRLDTDENFLRAVNSTKRGKKMEDDFDREFNLLRITKPKPKNKNNIDDGDDADVAVANTTVPAAAAAPWDEIDDFGDVGIRGNFMVLVEMDVERGSSAKPVLFARTNNDDAHPEWIGKPNFKKFKSKATAAVERRPTVELVLSEENDYGIGNTYWRAVASGSQTYSESHDVSVACPPPLSRNSKPKPKPSRARARGAPAPVPRADDGDKDDDVEVDSGDVRMNSDSDAVPVPQPPKSTTTTTAPSKGRNKQASSKAKTTTKANTRTKANAPAASTTRTTRGRTKKAPPPPKKKKSALFLSDDDDDVGSNEDEIEEVVVDREMEDESADVVAMQLGLGPTPDDDDDEEEDGGGGDDATALTSTLRSTAGTQLRRAAAARSTNKRRAAAAFVGENDDDDSDDAVFKGFGGGTSSTRARKRGRVG